MTTVTDVAPTTPPATPAPVAPVAPAPVAPAAQSTLITPTATSAPASGEPSAEAPSFDWRAALAGGDAKALARFERYSDPAAAGRAFLELERERREGVLPRPKDSWKPEDWSKFYSDLGRPATVDGYAVKVSVPTDAQPGMREAIEARLQDARAAAHEAGLTPQQWARLSQYVHDSVTSEMSAAHNAGQEYRQKTEQTLRQEWGEDFKVNVEYAKAALNEFQREAGFDADAMLGLQVVVDGKPVRLGDFAPFVKLAAAVGRRFGDDPYFVQSRLGGGQATVEAIEAKLADLMKLRATKPEAYAARQAEAVELAAAMERIKRRA